MDYGPRTKKQSTGLFFPPAGGRAVLISASLPQIEILRRGTAKDFYLVGESGFEPLKSTTTDLQSAPFGHSGIPPYEIVCLSVELVDGFEPPTC